MIATPVEVRGWGVFSGDVRIASCASAEAAQEVADAMNAVANMPTNGSGTRVWPGKVQWVRYPRQESHAGATRCEPMPFVDKHTAIAVEAVFVEFESLYALATDCFDTSAEAWASVRQMPEVR